MLNVEPSLINFHGRLYIKVLIIDCKFSILITATVINVEQIRLASSHTRVFGC